MTEPQQNSMNSYLPILCEQHLSGLTSIQERKKYNNGKALFPLIIVTLIYGYKH